VTGDSITHPNVKQPHCPEHGYSERCSIGHKGAGVKAKAPLQRLVHTELKAMGLSAQPAIHCVRKVAGACATSKADLKAGNYGREGSKNLHHTRHETHPRPRANYAALPSEPRS
jgi:hypothetical protein